MKQIKLYDIIPSRNIEVDNLSLGQRFFRKAFIKAGTKLYDIKCKDVFGHLLFYIEYIAPNDCFYVPNGNCKEHLKWYNWGYNDMEPILCELWDSQEEYDKANTLTPEIRINPPIYWDTAKTTQFTNVNSVNCEKCYTYLMKDESTGYYKIGMSNNPTYRERTLQSEKPTIKLLSYQEHFSREKARQKERYLHQIYKYARVRGEWFNLSKADVYQIEREFNE